MFPDRKPGPQSPGGTPPDAEAREGSPPGTAQENSSPGTAQENSPPGAADLDALRRRFANHVPGLLGADREYAVLCPLIEDADGLSLLFEVRASRIRQAGETCFPGGRLEPGETDIQCALRETEEELSIPREAVTILGRMDFLANQRGFLLRPALGLVSPAGFAKLRPAPAEVAEVFTVPLAFFRETAPDVYAYDLTPRPPEDFPYAAVGVPDPYPWAAGRVEVPVWYWQNHAIWGMTARIVRGLCS